MKDFCEELELWEEQVFRHRSNSIEREKGKMWSYRKNGSYGTSTSSRKIKELRLYEEL